MCNFIGLLKVLDKWPWLKLRSWWQKRVVVANLLVSCSMIINIIIISGDYRWKAFRKFKNVSQFTIRKFCIEIILNYVNINLITNGYSRITLHVQNEVGNVDQNIVLMCDWYCFVGIYITLTAVYNEWHYPYLSFAKAFLRHTLSVLNIKESHKSSYSLHIH